MTRATLYGIPNCDTMKKARAWLAEHGIEYVFHDYKQQGLDRPRLNAWIAELGWQTLLNTRGMMWRRLPQKTRDAIDEASAITLMLDTPSIVKRPVLEWRGKLHVGFKPDQYAAIFGA
ncbi:MAG: ArsC family reductase [Chromatiaceae bacterium]|nr:ArsC family reductase [Chromatiaceae bacterium]